jgi:hypothetical protein
MAYRVLGEHAGRKCGCCLGGDLKYGSGRGSRRFRVWEDGGGNKEPLTGVTHSRRYTFCWGKRNAALENRGRLSRAAPADWVMKIAVS